MFEMFVKRTLLSAIRYREEVGWRRGWLENRLDRDEVG